MPFYIIGSLLPPLSLSPDPPSVLQPPTNISVPLNRSAQFRCIPDGNPDPQISWQFQGVPIAGANGPIYSIAMVTGANGGQYTCVTSNAVGRTSATATLTVLCKCLNYWPWHKLCSLILRPLPPLVLWNAKEEGKISASQQPSELFRGAKEFTGSGIISESHHKEYYCCNVLWDTKAVSPTNILTWFVYFV